MSAIGQPGRQPSVGKPKSAGRSITGAGSKLCLRRLSNESTGSSFQKCRNLPAAHFRAVLISFFFHVHSRPVDNKYEFVRYQLAGAPGVLADKNASASISRAN